MSAAFQLQPCESRCGFPNCILSALHEGEHELSGVSFLTHPDADNERLAALVTPYGVGTRSYNRSPEKRELARQIEAAKLEHARDLKLEIEVPLACPCPQRPYPHNLSVHQELRSESYNPKFKFRWPWSLCLSQRMELSAERKSV